MKRFLRPVLGAAAVLAIGAGATLVGMRFAPAETVTAPGVTVQAPVLAPIGTGEQEPATELPSEELGEQEVTSIGTAPVELPADLEAVIDEVEAADDPALAISVYTDEAATAAASDPCATEGAADDCPAGLRSTILALDGVRELYVGATAFPDIREQHVDEGPYSLYPWCEPVEHSATEVPFGILSTAPANMVISYWPNSDPENVHTQFVSTSDADRAAYAAAEAAGTDMMEMPLARHCVVLTALEPDAAYTATVRAVDIFDRTVDARQVWFNSGGRLGVPGPEISTLGDNIIFAHALHTEDERVVIHGILAEEGAPAPTCDDAFTPSALIHESDRSVSADYLLERGVLPEYSHRANATFIVPEGSTFIVCVRVYPAGDGVPSWEADFPALETLIPIQVPDFVRPTVTVERLEIQRESRVRMASGTVEGIPCGEVLDNSGSTTSHLPFVLCDGARISPTVVLADELRNYGYRGDLVMKSTITPQGGSEFVRDSVLSLGQHRCDPACPTPERLWYRATLGAPGTTEFAVISVTWNQGRSNGAGDWVIPPIETTSPEYVRPAAPDFDRNAPVDGFTIDWEQKNVQFDYTLTVDRPVEYTVSVLSEGPDPALPCYDGATIATRSGHVDSSVDLYFRGLCLGTVYALNVELTDADGTTVRYGTKWSDTDYVRVPVTTPGWDGDLVWDITMGGPDDARVTAASFSVNGTRLLPDDAHDQCTTTDSLHYSGTTEVSLAQDNLVTAGAEWYTTPRMGVGCRSTSMEHHSNMWQSVTIDDIQWGSEAQGVWVHASDGYGTHVHLWMDDGR